MKKYVDKATVVAEIERRIKAYQNNFDKADNKIAKLSTDGRIQALKAILSFLDTLEVKEVDLEKELKKKIGNVGECDRRLAEYFFELGLKAQKGV